MSGLVRWLLVTLAITAIVHLTAVWAAPYVLMRVATDRLQSGNVVQVNTLHRPSRVTEASRAIVRPSPDLAYSVCTFDLSQGPLHLRAAAWDDYMSLSVFAANSDVIFVRNDRQSAAAIEITLALEGQKTPRGREVVISPSNTGIALVRRLAPDEARFSAATAAAAGDVCAPTR
ncbi:MAG: DUF1254 domain-containing protein [Pseudomonadales bacterium]